MTDAATLPASIRDLKSKARDLRTARKIPAEYYGKSKENLHLAFDYQTFRKLFKEAGTSSIVNLVVEGETEPREVLIHKIDYDPLTDAFSHIDLKQIERGKKITTKVPVILVGESPAVKNLGGVLTHGKNEIEIKCLPADLIKEIKIDISSLVEIGANIRVKDLHIDEIKHEILEEAETMVVAIIAPKTTEEVEAEDAEDSDKAVSDDVAKEAEEEKAAAQASKESDTEKKGGEK
ncbi:50S ribosomal protein L25 [Candidatus Gracilibacteria bacterium]|nr:50S ribosomal protein L25 [Candidatus Gracilibacteria bacterium]MCF7856431.1 50S ribosomal protein L25 [Candidatus Gracilibacteria bacterium]MCF7896574.1 50S ribosomal protein L25 [Candidatus Gracilibacteria bacterium]